MVTTQVQAVAESAVTLGSVELLAVSRLFLRRATTAETEALRQAHQVPAVVEVRHQSGLTAAQRQVAQAAQEQRPQHSQAQQL
jgi:hypothetical protein